VKTQEVEAVDKVAATKVKKVAGEEDPVAIVSLKRTWRKSSVTAAARKAT
jgi:hydrogenase maturation factor HypE